MLRRLALLIGCLLVPALAWAQWAIFGCGLATCTGGAWVQMKIGVGGYSTGIYIAPDGHQILRTDTTGVFYRTSGSVPWHQVITHTGMPSGFNTWGLLQGACEVAISASNSSHIYLWYPNVAGTAFVFGSTNSGTTWTQLNGTGWPTINCAPNNTAVPSDRLKGPFMAVDPSNENIVVVGTRSSGVYYSTNAGTTWTQISTASIPAGTTPPGSAEGAGNLIAFDPHSGTGASGCGSQPSCTQGIFISAYGTGIYHTTGGIAGSWTELNSASMPTTFNKLQVDPAGSVWVVDDVGGTQDGSLWRWGNISSCSPTNSCSWQQQISSGTSRIAAVAVNPSNSAVVYAITDSTPIWYSSNAQAATPAWTQNTNATKTGAIPWISAALDAIFIQMAAIDPTTGTLYETGGYGVFQVQSPPTTGTPAFNHDNTAGVGIENMIPTAMHATPSGTPTVMLGAWDRALWMVTNPGVYQSRYFPDSAFAAGCCIRDSGPGALPPNYGIIGLSVSTTGGGIGTWSDITGPSTPGFNGGGWFYPISATSWIWASSNFGPYVTTNSGSTWTACTFSGGTVFADGGGWTDNFFVFYQRHMAQDATDPNTFLIYNDGTGTNNGTGSHTNGAGATGFWRTTNGCGSAMTQIGVSPAPGTQLLPRSSYNGFVIKNVPGQHCNFIAGGQVFQFDGNGLPDSFNTIWYSQDCGAHWTQITNMESNFAFAFGAAKPGNTYPTLYCVCWVNQGSGFTYGTWESDNMPSATPTWTQIGDGYPLNTDDFVWDLEADVNTYGTVYGAFGSSGWFYRTKN